MVTIFIYTLLCFAVLVPTGLYWRQMVKQNQRKHDLDRDVFEVVFPTGMAEDRVKAFINSIGSTLNVNIVRNGGAPTIVFEVVATDKGISHRVRFPSYDDEYLIGQLEANLPGIDVNPVEDEDDPEYQFAARLYMTEPTRPLRISRTQDATTRILKATQTDHPGERVVLQWVVAHSEMDKTEDDGVIKPTVLQAVVLGAKAEKPAKPKRPATSEQNFVAVGRIAAVAEDEKRAKQLVMKVLRALQSEGGSNKIYAKQITSISDVHEATTPTRSLGNLFTATELGAHIAWPIGDPQIPGLQQGAARRFPATENIAREGWVFGHSDVSGRPRPIALALPDVLRHTVIVGGPGSGKTAFANHGVVQMLGDGFGAIILDAGTDISMERLYYRVLNTIPEHRLDDVVLINPSGDPQNSVALNPLDQGFGTAIIDIVIDTFVGMYPSIADTVNFREVVRHGLWTLIEHGGHTLVDLPSLLAPRNVVEREWAAKLINSVKDPELKDFWDRNPGALVKDNVAWGRKVESIINKLWNLTLDPNVRHFLGQTNSTIQIRDVLDNNKILMVSLGGMDPEAAQQVANLLTKMIWRATQVREENGVKLEHPNVFVVDEFQVLAGSHATIADMLARGRALGLGVVLATQFITRRSIDEDLRGTVLQSANTQIVFKAEGREAGLWAQQLGRHAVNDTDITRLQRFHGIAKIVGESSPVTFTATKPLEPIKGRAEYAEQLSRNKFARNVNDVRREIEERRRAAHHKPATPRKQTGAVDWEPDDERKSEHG